MPKDLKAIFIKHLKARGLLFTAQRARILNEVLKEEGHFWADELHMRLGSGPNRVSRATVYRALELLVESGVVEKLRFGEEHYRFERTRIGKHHDHLVCGNCGRVIEFYNERIEGLQNDICREMGFVPAGHRLVIFGHCERCRNAGVRESNCDADHEGRRKQG